MSLPSKPKLSLNAGSRLVVSVALLCNRQVNDGEMDGLGEGEI